MTLEWYKKKFKSLPGDGSQAPELGRDFYLKQILDMKTAIVTLKSLTPITFGKYHQTEKLNKESAEDYELRTWRNKCHTENDNCIIPGIMIANCIRESAKYLNIQIKGKGKSTYTKHFDSGISLFDNINLNYKKEQLTEEENMIAVHVPSDGMRGGTKRVMRYFPKFNSWQGTIKVYIGDDIITPDIFESVVINAGSLIGLGTWRPRNRGNNGRFELVDMNWEDQR